MTEPARVFLTGAAGFVGSHLAERLVADGFRVRALVRKSSDLSLLKSAGIEIVFGDLKDAAPLEEAVRGCRHIYNLAAKTATGGSSKQEYYAVNLQGAENLCRAAVKAGIERFVQCSSAGIYGILFKAPVDENSPPNPNSFYRDSKLLAERMILDFQRKEALPVVIARLSSVYGPRSMNWRNLFQDVAAKRFRMIGSGKNKIQMGYVADIVDGLRLCGDTPNIEGQDYILTGAEAVTVRDFVNMIARETGAGASRGYSGIPAFPFYPLAIAGNFVFRTFGREIPYSHQVDFFLSEKLFSIAKAKTELGYAPKVGVSEGIARSVKWYRENGFL